MPTILLRFAAGALADRWDKKRVMLACDLVAALGLSRLGKAMRRELDGEGE